jgi:predicted protein tyrosine phosphatase
MQEPFRITVCGIEELAGHCETRASHVLSILDPDYPVPEAFGQYGEHERLELRFHDIIEATPGSVLPQPEHVERILAFGRDLMADPSANLLVHCHAGISRSTAAMALILAQAQPSLAAEAVLGQVHAIREKAWPNLRIMEMGDTMLGRGGSLVAATHALHGLQLAVRPRLAELMTQGGRGREVAEATKPSP